MHVAVGRGNVTDQGKIKMRIGRTRTSVRTMEQHPVIFSRVSYEALETLHGVFFCESTLLGVIVAILRIVFCVQTMVTRSKLA